MWHFNFTHCMIISELHDLFHNYVVPFNMTTFYLAATINGKEWMNPHISMPGKSAVQRDKCEDAEPVCSPEQVTA